MALAYTVLPRELSLRSNPRGKFITYLSHLFQIQLKPSFTTTPIPHILFILTFSSSEQVVRPTAGSIIAFMKDMITLRNRANAQFVGKAMARHLLSVISGVTVTCVTDSACPNPTRTQIGDMRRNGAILIKTFMERFFSKNSACFHGLLSDKLSLSGQCE